MAKVFCTFVIIHPGLFSSPNKVSSLSWTRRRGSDKLAPLIITNLNLSKFWLTCYHLPGIGVLFEINIFSHGHLHESKVWNLCFVNSFLAFPVFTLSWYLHDVVYDFLVVRTIKTCHFSVLFIDYTIQQQSEFESDSAH